MATWINNSINNRINSRASLTLTCRPTLQWQALAVPRYQRKYAAGIRCNFKHPARFDAAEEQKHAMRPGDHQRDGTRCLPTSLQLQLVASLISPLPL